MRAKRAEHAHGVKKYGIELLTTMRKTLVCIFAHPDDEAFGPGGTIAKFAKTHDVYILCATCGEAGGVGAQQEIAKIRDAELLESAKILGVKKVYFLGFIDGTLSNSIYHKLAGKIKEKLNEIKPETLLTFEPLGISGHTDHIVVSNVTTYVFEQLSYIKKVLYYCRSQENMRVMKKMRKEYFVYRPDGYNPKDIGFTCDVEDTWEIKVAAMKKHKSQNQDLRWLLSYYQEIPKKEYFLVKRK